MPGIFERISSLAGSEVEKAANLAHQTFQSSVGQHGHHGRAFIETVVKLCRDHPNLVGIAVGILVEQLLSEEKKEYEQHHPVAAAPAPDAVTGEAAGEPSDQAALFPPVGPALPAPSEHGAAHDLAVHRIHHVDLHHIRPGRIAIEVFGGLLLLKFGAAFGHMLRRKHPRPDGWIGQASKIHLLSGTLATYYFARSLRSEKVSAWRNAAIGLFGTDAIKPLLKPQKPAKAARR